MKINPLQSPICAVGCESGDQAGQSAWRRALPIGGSNESRTMTRARGATRVATAVLLLVAITACADGGNDPSKGLVLLLAVAVDIMSKRKKS